MRTGNLFENADPPTEGERFETLLNHHNLTVERILSSATPDATEYVQPQDEWVALLRGSATLEVSGERVELKTGDSLFLPALTPHRVMETSPGALWLAVHLHP